ncbi:tumor necrosis factor receptor superfamily member 6 [Aulostomus maculatus]
MGNELHLTPGWSFLFALFCFHWFVGLPSALSQAEPACADGSYKHGDITCCKCGAGQKLKEDCSENPYDGQCELCDTGTYNSLPNYQRSCLPCSSCSHPYANQVEEEPCTRARDAKCRCKEHHYCRSGNENTCKLCDPCKKCGAEGIKAACTAINDTVCNEETERGAPLATILGIVLPVAILIIVGFIIFFWRRKKLSRNHLISNRQENGNNTNEVEMQPIRAVDLSNHIVDIARLLGWKDMKEVAMRSNIKDTTIEACELNHPRDAEEQTLQLLQAWVEAQGTEASSKLIQILRNMDKQVKAKKVEMILAV